VLRGQPHASAALYPQKNPVPIVQEAGWAPGTAWTGAENLDPTGIRSPDRPARSQYVFGILRIIKSGYVPKQNYPVGLCN